MQNRLVLSNLYFLRGFTGFTETMKLQYIENTIYKVNPVEYETIIIKLNITLQGMENANYKVNSIQY